MCTVVFTTRIHNQWCLVKKLLLDAFGFFELLNGGRHVLFIHPCVDIIKLLDVSLVITHYHWNLCVV